MNKTQRNLHENDESKPTLPFFCYHHLCVRYSSVLHWVSKSWIRVEQSEEKIKRAWKQPGDKTTIRRSKHRQDHQGYAWYVHCIFLVLRSIYTQLKFNKYWNVSYHPEKNILQDSTMINFAYVYPVFWSQFACDWLLLINERNVHERSFSSVCVLTAFQAS